jgi:hypothetical protein
MRGEVPSLRAACGEAIQKKNYELRIRNYELERHYEPLAAKQSRSLER